MQSIPFAGGAYEGASRIISAQQSINCYPEIGDGVVSQQGAPGTELAVDLGQPIRAMKSAWDRLYAVAGDSVYRISPANVATLLGTITNDGLTASLSNNIFELLIVSNGQGWVAQKETNVLTAIADPDFPNTSKSDFLDGYGLLVEKDSGRFRFTTINDFETISGIDFATAEGSPDNLVTLIVDHREIWLFGTETIEIWFNVGNATNPFQRQAFIEKGCKGVFSPAKLDNTVFWLGNNGVVYRANGFQPLRVSNFGIEHQISKTTVDPIGFAHTWQGHDFYYLNFPGELTIVYDASIPDPNKAWHTRESRDRLDSVYHHHASVYSKEYVGGADGKIYTLGGFSHNGDELVRTRTIGPVRANGYATIASLTLLFETGSGSNPVDPDKVFIEISDDSGRTYGGRIEASIGAQGDYTTEVKFLGLGGFYDNQRVLKITMTDNARYSLVDAIVT